MSAAKPTAKTDDGHTCDAGHFDRTICPAPCNSMHFYCSGCGARQDVCTHDLSGQDLEIPTAEAIAEALLQYETGDESLTQFPADEAFRSHLARAVLDAIESGAEHG